MLLLLIVLAAWTSPFAQAQNSPPEIYKEIPDIEVRLEAPLVPVGFVGDYFNDPDGDELTFTSWSENSRVAELDPTALSQGLILVIHKRTGSTVIHVTASDPSEAVVEDAFTVTVTGGNAPPVVDFPIVDQDLTVGDAPFTVDLATVFSDPDGNPLAFSAGSSDAGIAGASLSGTVLEISAVSGGVATITVTAEDGSGGSVQDLFDVTVNAPPVVADALPDQTLTVGETTFVRDLEAAPPVFVDPDGDPLTYGVQTSDPGVATAVLTGTSLEVAAQGSGTATVTVTADDGRGGTTMEAFEVTGNTSPLVAVPIADQELTVGDDPFSVDLAVVFSDPDGDELGFVVQTTDAAVASAGLSGTVLEVSAVSGGGATVTVTADDGRGGSVEDAFEVTVHAANAPPVVADPVADQALTLLDPPFSRDLDAAPSVFSDADGDALTYSVSSADPGVAAAGLSGTSVTVTPLARGATTVTVSADDGNGGVVEETFDVTVVNTAPTVGVITAPVEPTAISDPIQAEAPFTDPDPGDTHAATWDWGDGASTQGDVTEPNGSPGSVTGSHTYAVAGVYTVTLTLTDDEQAGGQATFEFVVIYDPSAGNVSGSGAIDSPEGAYVSEPTLTGKATFGFVSKYKKGSTTPSGRTQFRFQVAGVHFQSTSYDWLVVAGAKAMYKGEGEINRAGSYGFQLSAIDAALTSSTDEDLFRIRIWDKNNGDALVYDNKVDETDDNADPTTVLTRGNIKIQSGGNGNNRLTEAAESAGESVLGEVPGDYALHQNYPNPFNPSTAIGFDLPVASDVHVLVYDLMGREVAQLVDRMLPAGRHTVTWEAGPLPSGTYFYRITAGDFVKVRRMQLVR